MNKQELSLFDCVMLGIGSALGPEIFLLLGLAASLAGTQAIISLGIAFVIALLIGLCYAELATAIPVSGEDYIFARRAFRGMLPFLVGWMVWLGNIVYSAFNAIAVAYFLKIIIPVPVGFTAISFIAFAGALIYLGMRTLKRVQNVMVAALVVLLAVFVYSGVGVGDWSYLPGILNGNMGAAFSTAALLFVAFIGFEDIVSVSAEIREPKKTIPRAIILTLVALAVIYISVSLTVFAVLPLSQVMSSENAVLDAASVSMGDAGKLLFSIAGLLAIATSLNAAMTAGTMNAFALGRDGYLPRRLALRGPHGTAAIAILATAMIAIVFAATEAVAFVAYLTDFAYFLAMTVSAYALIVLRKRQPSLERPFKVPFYPYIPLAAILLSAMALIFINPRSIIVGALWLLAGVLAYYLYVIGLNRLKIALGGVLLFLATICFTAYFLVEAAYFSLPHYASFNVNGIVLLAALACSAAGLYLMLFSCQSKSLCKKGQARKNIDN
ncbi:MAG: APC family permease [Candidatus Burarchaeum sp.]|nr:APC family permease [Candidatus Burarchaeum sp.]MDO8340049.1 APC family permease [Candidatus Burarchaeum sp.]